MTLRPGDRADAAACAAIFNAWVDATGWMPRVHPPEDVERHYRDHVFAAQAVTVAARDDAILGFAAHGDGWVHQLYIAAAARGDGIGAALLAAARAAHPDGLRLWTFVANAGARRFYERAGFVEAGRTAGDNEERLPDVLLAWAPGGGIRAPSSERSCPSPGPEAGATLGRRISAVDEIRLRPPPPGRTQTRPRGGHTRIWSRMGMLRPPSPPPSRAPANGPAEAVPRLVGLSTRGPGARFGWKETCESGRAPGGPRHG